MNVAVGGTNGYFPDNWCNKPYSNWKGHPEGDFIKNKDQWFPTWNYPMTNDAAMKVDWVRVYQDDGQEGEDAPTYFNKMKNFLVNLI